MNDRQLLACLSELGQQQPAMLVLHLHNTNSQLLHHTVNIATAGPTVIPYDSYGMHGLCQMQPHFVRV